MNKKLSLCQRIHNAHGSQEVEEVKALHCYLHTRGQATEEWTTLWSRNEDCSWAHFFGRMRGWDEVWNGSVTQYDKKAYANYCRICDIYPEIGGLDPRCFLSVVLHTLASGVVEVAEDGRSARSLFYTPGVMSATLNPDRKKECRFLWERYGSDFIYEDGRWLYLHEQVCPDIDGDIDTGNWAREAYEVAIDPNRQAHFAGGPPDAGEGIVIGPPCTDPGPLHIGYRPTQTVQNTVPWPEPYVTMDENNTYTPPQYVKGEK